MAARQLTIVQAVVARLHADLQASRNAKREAEEEATHAKLAMAVKTEALISAGASVSRWRARARLSLTALITARQRLERMASLIEGDVWRYR